MGKGTPSMGKRAGRVVHIRCRRCGRRAYHVRKKRCGACGYGATAALRHYHWQRKTLQRVRVV
ncbi:MAG: 50S ribosomal protein L37e [Nitrososphaerota archaeon]|jgi:large subunit ribosomal protein L37e|uniref:50S ribosomal protein L37e n=1 Tax=Candidatus Bathycorpusculum sp. TaxID=2994959 RepID=UPI002817F2A0|nr:50S ribosomal protein L37e [Candidatus Termiticorpusculum sp.]MCL2257183.1 50S ribosomal protein L37e [Candidatus Termiticorpusculum sp.]MCL2292686.1 50S ribosomal protein L37e [Candidatus Termiticorpusculum sp.]MDR0461539.1 50S ribosomal protein L37e [Nitrososphaerota archaeon]